MLFFAAELLAMILVPAALTILWKKRSQAAWTCVFTALATYAVSFFVFPHFSRIVIQPFMPVGVQPLLTISHIERALAVGFLKYSIWWIAMRIRITKLSTWQNATIFGLTYSTAAAVFMLLSRTKFLAQHAVNTLKINPTEEPMSTLQNLTALAEIPVDQLNDYIIKYGWRSHTFYSLLDAGVINVILNVATALAILYSIRHKRIWTFGAAILCYTLVSVGTSQPAMLSYTMIVRSNLRLPTVIGDLVYFLAELFISDNSARFSLIITHTQIFLYIAIALPSVALALYMRRALNLTQAEND